MPLIFIFVVGMGVALFRRHLLVTPQQRAAQGDVPARLVAWAEGLLDPSRADWGRAMIGELDHLDGRPRRWRFALGCVSGALLLPPWGRAATALGAMLAVAVSAGGLDLYTHLHYRLGVDGWTWAGAVLLVIFLAGYVLGGSILLRRPGVAGPGLVGGLAVAAAWLVAGGLTFQGWVNSLGLGSEQWLLLLAPVVVGAGATVWGGSAAIGRRAARLAAVTAALTIYLYGVLAVAVLGATGHDPSDGWTTAQVVNDNLGNQATFYLFALPLVTVSVGWAAAAATARLRHAPQTSAAPAELLATPPTDQLLAGQPRTEVESRPVSGATATPAGPPDQLPADAMSGRRRTWYFLLLGAALAVSAFLVFLALLAPQRR